MNYNLIMTIIVGLIMAPVLFLFFRSIYKVIKLHFYISRQSRRSP